MNKMAILLIALMIVSVSFLSGCDSSDKDKLVGTWVSTDENIQSSFRIYSDGSHQGLPEELNFWIDKKWDVKDGSLVFYSGNYERAYDYAFLTKGDIIHVVLARGNFICEYEKQ
ncbi:MAG: hypothetical protein FK734_19900 [Asgard group archaeon]|nr:hypothetical protein [Asgard group archaeon]